MTQNYHTPHSIGFALTASSFNGVYSDLDAGITSNNPGTGNDGEVLISDASATNGRRWGDYAPMGYVAGYRVDVAGSVVTVSAGVARASNNADNLQSTGGFAIDPLGTGVNGLDTGALGNNTWYRVFAIKNPTTQAVAGLMSISDTPTMPAGYTLRRRIGFVRTNASATMHRQVTLGSGIARRVMWLEDTTAAPFLLLNQLNVNTTWDSINAAGVVPPTSQQMICYLERLAAGGILRMRAAASQVMTLAPVAIIGAPMEIPLTTSQGFELISTAAGDEDVTVQALGYVDDLMTGVV